MTCKDTVSYGPKSTKVRNKILRYKFKFSQILNLNLHRESTGESETLDLADFGDRAFSVETGIPVSHVP